MGLKVDLRAFLEAGAEAGIGLLQGRMAGEETMRQRQQQEYTQLLQAAQMAQKQYETEQADIFRALPYAEAEGQATLLGQAFRTRDPLAALRESSWVKRYPDLMRAYGPQPSRVQGVLAQQKPAGGAGVTAPLGEREFAGPGGVPPRVSGLTKSEAEKIRNEFASLEKTFTELPDDPDLRARINTLRQSFPTQIKTPEDARQARNVLFQLHQERQGASRLLATAKTKEEKDVHAAIREHVKGMNPWQVTPDLVRSFYKNFSGKDYSHLIAGQRMPNWTSRVDHSGIGARN